MLTLDKRRLRLAMQKRGVPSVLALSRALKLHRNTINFYLSGHSVYQQSYLKFCEYLGVTAHDMVCTKLRPELPADIALLLDQLVRLYPQLVFVLFGSRARGVAKQFSDWDIGFFSEQQISHDQHLELLVEADKFSGDIINTVDLVNLNQASHDFLHDNREDFIYLTGSLTQWNNFITRLNNAKINLK